MYKNEAINAIFKIAENVAKKHELKLGKETADKNPLSTADFSKLVDSKKEEALKSFKRKSSKYDDELLQQPMLNLDQKLQSINDSFILENMDKLEKLNLRLEQVENELIQEYETSMQKKCYQNPIEQSQFLKELEAEETKALQEFDKRFNIEFDFLKQPALVELRKKIREKQKHYEEINMFNLKQQQEDLKTIAVIEDHYKSSMIGNLQGTYTAPGKLDEFHEQSMNRAKKLAQQKLGATYSKHLNALTVAIRFHKTDFMNSNENFKKHAQIEFEKKKELCYEEYKSNMKKMLHKSEYYGNIESKHNQYKQIAVDEYRSIEGEPIREFNHIESKLKEKIEKQLKLFKHQNEIYKDEEDQQEKQVWDDAILRFELKIEKVMKENRRRRNKKVEKKYLEFVEDLLTGYRSNVADRFKYRERFLKEKLELIYYEKEESLCTLL